MSPEVITHEAALPRSTSADQLGSDGNEWLFGSNLEAYASGIVCRGSNPINFE